MSHLSLNTQHWPNEWQSGIIRTSNSMGIMTTELSPIGRQFAEFAKSAQMPLLDIGASFGVSTYPALQNGAHLIACDLSQPDLDILRMGVPPHLLTKLQTLCAGFPKDLNFEKRSLSGIHISMVLHFLRGHEIEDGLTKCHQWLTGDGKLFIVVMTPHHGIFSNVTPAYEANVKSGKKWPGVLDLDSHVPKAWKEQLPPFAHFFMPDVLQSAVVAAGFGIEEMDFFCYENFPAQYKTNGKEFLGLVARKP